MLNHELCKKLREAKFPGKCLCGDVRCFPTLEELIDACGEKFVALIKLDNSSGWSAAKEGDQIFGIPKPKEGQTPSEAVAKLWLELNEN